MFATPTSKMFVLQRCILLRSAFDLQALPQAVPASAAKALMAPDRESFRALSGEKSLAYNKLSTPKYTIAATCSLALAGDANLSVLVSEAAAVHLDLIRDLCRGTCARIGVRRVTSSLVKEIPLLSGFVRGHRACDQVSSFF